MRKWGVFLKPSLLWTLGGQKNSNNKGLFTRHRATFSFIWSHVSVHHMNSCPIFNILALFLAPPIPFFHFLHLLTFQKNLLSEEGLPLFFFLIRWSIRLKHATSGLGEICIDLWPYCSVLELMCLCCPLGLIIRSPGCELWQRLHLHWFSRNFHLTPGC